MNPLPISDVVHPEHKKQSLCQFLSSKQMNRLPEPPAEWGVYKEMEMWKGDEEEEERDELKWHI